MNIDLRHSLWTKDLDTWKRRAPGALQALRDYVANGTPFEICTYPSKEIRYGVVHSVDPSTVHVEFWTAWDEEEDLVDTVLGSSLSEQHVNAVLDAVEIPYNPEGSPGVLREELLTITPDLDTLLAAVDSVEEELLTDDEARWEEVKAQMEWFR